MAVTLAIVAGACGGSDDSGDGVAQTPDSVATTSGSADDSGASSGAGGAEARSVEAEVPASLEFLGGIPVAEEAHVVGFSDQPGEFTFGDGTRVEVPAGAFAAATDVSAVRVTLDFDQYDSNLSDGVGYVLSTEGDVDLAEPIHLEIATEGNVVQLRDGEWETLEGTRIPIEHFSEVPTVVVEPQPETESVAGDLPDGNTDAEFLFVCIQFLGNAFNDPQGARGLGVQLAFDICVRALIERYEPGDTYVSTACVADKIDGPDLRAAVDQCAAEARAGDDAAQEQPEAGGEEPPAEPPAPSSAGTTVVFDGELETGDAVLTVGWEAALSDGAGTGTGVLFLDGPCTEGIDGEPGGAVIEQISAAVEFAVDVTTDGDTLAVTVSAPTLADYSGQDEFCREVFTQNLDGFLPFLEGSVPADSGPATVGSFIGTLTIDES